METHKKSLERQTPHNQHGKRMAHQQRRTFENWHTIQGKHQRILQEERRKGKGINIKDGKNSLWQQKKKTQHNEKEKGEAEENPQRWAKPKRLVMQKKETKNKNVTKK